MTLVEIAEMAFAVSEEEKRHAEFEYYLTAWQTSLLMNATGNYKTRITPEKLLGKDFGKEKKQPQVKSKEEQDTEMKKLKEKFGI